MRGGSWGSGCEARGARETEPIGRGVTQQRLRPSDGSSRGLEAANKSEIGDDDGREMPDFKGIKWTIDTVEAHNGQDCPDFCSMPIADIFAAVSSPEGCSSKGLGDGIIGRLAAIVVIQRQWAGRETVGAMEIRKVAAGDPAVFVG
jgi:hypothetical protein